jgi:ketosteroid isomerase-like protein
VLRRSDANQHRVSPDSVHGLLTGSQTEREVISVKIVSALVLGGVLLVSVGAQAQDIDSGTSASAERLKQEVLKVEAERNDAIVKGDVAALAKMYSDEISWTNPRGELLTKSQVLSHLQSGEQKFFSIKHSDRQMHVYGNTVVMTVFTRSSVRYKGKTSDAPRRFTNVFVKENGHWLLVVHHATPVLPD